MSGVVTTALLEESLGRGAMKKMGLSRSILMLHKWLPGVLSQCGVADIKAAAFVLVSLHENVARDGAMHVDVPPLMRAVFFAAVLAAMLVAVQNTALNMGGRAIALVRALALAVVLALLLVCAPTNVGARPRCCRPA